MSEQSQQRYEHLLTQQEASLHGLRTQLMNTSSVVSSEQIESVAERCGERLERKLAYHTGLTIVSASLLSLMISFYFNR